MIIIAKKKKDKMNTININVKFLIGYVDMDRERDMPVLHCLFDIIGRQQWIDFDIEEKGI